MASGDVAASALDSPLVIPFEQDCADPPIDGVLAEQDADELRGASLATPLTRSSGFAEGSFGAVLRRERENVMRVRTPDLLGVLSRNAGSV
jgi:hypothetical protein